MYGCDSVVVLNLFVRDAVVNRHDVSICSDELPYVFNGKQCYTAGEYVDSLIAQNGNDSLEILSLTVNPVEHYLLVDTVCSNAVYEFNGKYYTESGTYTDTLKTYLGCDSIVTLELTVNSVKKDTVDAEICEGKTFAFNGVEYSASGYYTYDGKTFDGCDSTVVLRLVVVPAERDTVSERICDGEIYEFLEKTYTQSGAYTDTVRNEEGCLEIKTLLLSVAENSVTEKDTVITQGDTLLYNGRIITSSGAYTDTLVNMNGCDSIVILHVSTQSGLDNTGITVMTELYPNPASGMSYLLINGLPYKKEITVTDSYGREILRTALDEATSRYELDLQRLESGVYYVRISSMNYTKVHKLIKK